MTTASGTGGDGNWVRHSRLRPRARTGTLGTVLGRGDAPGMTIAARSGVIPNTGPGRERVSSSRSPSKAPILQATM
jgi:hypothetical protein